MPASSASAILRGGSRSAPAQAIAALVEKSPLSLLAGTSTLKGGVSAAGRTPPDTASA